MDKQQALDLYNANRRKAEVLLALITPTSTRGESERIKEQITTLAEESAHACKQAFIPLEFAALSGLTLRQEEPVTLEQIQDVMDHPILRAKIAVEMLARIAELRAEMVGRQDDAEGENAVERVLN